MHDEWLTPAQVAERLQIGVETVKQHLRHGRLPGKKIGKFWRVRAVDLEAFLAGHAVASKDAC